jgi:hypothetical protein
MQITESILEFNLQWKIVSDNENQRETTPSYIDKKLPLLSSIHVRQTNSAAAGQT